MMIHRLHLQYKMYIYFHDDDDDIDELREAIRRASTKYSKNTYQAVRLMDRYIYPMKSKHHHRHRNPNHQDDAVIQVQVLQ